jgi:hypothetical protein
MRLEQQADEGVARDHTEWFSFPPSDKKRLEHTLTQKLKTLEKGGLIQQFTRTAPLEKGRERREEGKKRRGREKVLSKAAFRSWQNELADIELPASGFTRRSSFIISV